MWYFPRAIPKRGLQNGRHARLSADPVGHGRAHVGTRRSIFRPLSADRRPDLLKAVNLDSKAGRMGSTAVSSYSAEEKFHGGQAGDNSDAGACWLV